MDFIKIALIILISIITVSCLPVFDKAVSAVINITVSLLIVYMVIDTIFPVISKLKSIFQNQFTGDLTIVFKAMGISLVTQFIADIALDNGNKSLANGMILTGKLAIIVLALPVYMEVLGIMEKIIK